MKISNRLLALVFGIFVLSSYNIYAAVDKSEQSNEKWEFYGSDENDNLYTYNPKTVQHLHGNIVRVWVKAVYSEKETKLKEGIFLWEIDCSKKSWRGIKAYTKGKDNKSSALTSPSIWSAIPAESTAESLYDILCKKGKKAQKN